MTIRPWVLAVCSLAFFGPVSGFALADNVFEGAPVATSGCEIDRLVLARLAPMGIQPTLCSDEVFVRRLFLDVTGTLPTAEEARSFIRDPDVEHKRSRLIELLLNSPESDNYRAMKWSDILRIKAEFPVNLWPNAAQAYHRWVLSSIAAGKPYDQFARELLTSSGSNFRVGPVNFYRALQDKTPEGISAAVALTFMGTRTDTWPPEQRANLAVFFSQVAYKPTREWKEEIVFWDPYGAQEWEAYDLALAEAAKPPPAPPANGPAVAPNPAPNPAPQPAQPNAPQPAVVHPAPAPPPPPVRPVPKPLGATAFPDGTAVQPGPDRDPREVFADWLIRPENPWFTRNIANRIWSRLVGRGIVHEPDDLRPDNPPSNPELLAYLEKELIGSGYDLKHLHRLILNSKAYQFSSVTRFDQPEAAANFAGYPVRRLEAEVLIDALNQITGTSDLYTSPIPEPFTYIPDDMPATAIADGSITSPFLALFGRSARASGMENERSNDLGASQWLHMLNSTHIQGKLEKGPGILALVSSKRPMPEIVEELYLTILSRFPTEEEVTQITAYGKAGPAKRREDWNDLVWALLNSTEFLFRH